jgi:hypothetical protein
VPLAGVTLSQPAPPLPTAALQEVVDGTVRVALPMNALAGSTALVGASPAADAA